MKKKNLRFFEEACGTTDDLYIDDEADIDEESDYSKSSSSSGTLQPQNKVVKDDFIKAKEELKSSINETDISKLRQ